MLKALCGLFVTFLSVNAHAFTEPDWSAQAQLVPGEDRANIYSLPEATQHDWVIDGKNHALRYPVEITGMLIPYRPLKNFLSSGLAAGLSPFKDIADMYRWLGLPAFPAELPADVARDPLSPYFVPLPTAGEAGRPQAMGASYLDLPEGTGITFSCAGCHSSNLFGRPVLGLPSKRSRANEFFILGLKHAPRIPPSILMTVGATPGEVALFRRTRDSLRNVDARSPQALGLDTSLAQTALSLMRREPDEHATLSERARRSPRPNRLSTLVADSKPMPWWNARYKTRWLADGSLVSGNPIFTNFLWNEIGRGQDLHRLAEWLERNEDKMRVLTAAVFGSRAPRWTDYFDATSIDLPRAKRGGELFDRTCASCHGHYEKAWAAPGSEQLPLDRQLETLRVLYHSRTPVLNVGTDPQRAEGMRYFAEDLNRLAISRKFGTVVESQTGYVPPPLVGVWARYPYFHNASAPTLCSVLTPVARRPGVFYLGPADDPRTDFDPECVGYPVGGREPRSWRVAENRVDTSRPGLSNRGHESMLLKDDGSEKFDVEEKRALVEFLKTL